MSEHAEKVQLEGWRRAFVEGYLQSYANQSGTPCEQLLGTDLHVAAVNRSRKAYPDPQKPREITLSDSSRARIVDGVWQYSAYGNRWINATLNLSDIRALHDLLERPNE